MKYVGVDIGGTNLKAGLVDESGTLLATQKMKVASIVDREGLAWTVASLVQELAKAANIPVSDVASVGVGRSRNGGYTGGFYRVYLQPSPAGRAAAKAVSQISEHPALHRK